MRHGVRHAGGAALSAGLGLAKFGRRVIDLLHLTPCESDSPSHWTVPIGTAGAPRPIGLPLFSIPGHRANDLWCC